MGSHIKRSPISLSAYQWPGSLICCSIAYQRLSATCQPLISANVWWQRKLWPLPLSTVTLTSVQTRAPFSRAATTLAQSFRLLKRADGSTYVALDSAAPEWTRTAAMLAHDGELPNDARYDLIRSAATAIADQLFDSADDARDAIHDLTVDLLPTYTGELVAWFADRPARLGDCDDVISEGIRIDSTYDLLSAGYQRAAESVLSVLIAEIAASSGSVFDPDYDCQLLISDSQGIYVPQVWASGMDKADALSSKVDWGDVKICQSGPDNEAYWEAWQAILDSAEIADPDGSVWTLYQNGDLWAIRQGVELPEDWA